VKTWNVTLKVNEHTVHSRAMAATRDEAGSIALTAAMLDEWDRIRAAAKVVECVEIVLAPQPSES